MEFVFNPENVLVWLKALLIKLYSAPNAQWNTKKYWECELQFYFQFSFFVPEKGLQKGFNDLVIYGNPMILLSKKHTSPIRGYKDFSLPGNVF